VRVSIEHNKTDAFVIIKNLLTIKISDEVLFRESYYRYKYTVFRRSWSAPRPLGKVWRPSAVE